MASFEREVARVIDKFNEGNFNLEKFKIEILLASMDLWDIVDGSKETPLSYVEPNVSPILRTHGVVIFKHC